MKLYSDHEGVVMQMLRRSVLALVFLVGLAGSVHAQNDPLPSLNDGPR
jgi:hypothetical protein